MTLTRKGWNSLKPITAPDQMPAPIHWNPMYKQLLITG